MSVFLAIVILSLNVGKSGGAIKPVVTFTPNWGNILYYDSVTLTCDVPSTVPEEPRTYHWYRNQTKIEGDQQNLHIIGSSVGRDRGDYQCQTIGGDISDPVFLDVTINYVILQRPPSVIYEGDPLTLRCHHVKDFNATNTNFYKDDQEIKSSESDSTFHIPNITRSQSGRYKCTKQIYSSNSSNVHGNSDESFISVKVYPVCRDSLVTCCLDKVHRQSVAHQDDADVKSIVSYSKLAQRIVLFLAGEKTF
ncbi:low affinity immunoglobulin gamma Fc region receptor III-B-like [Lithobates pipiens]